MQGNLSLLPREDFLAQENGAAEEHGQVEEEQGPVQGTAAGGADERVRAAAASKHGEHKHHDPDDAHEHQLPHWEQRRLFAVEGSQPAQW